MTVQNYYDAMSDHGFTDLTTARELEVLNDTYYEFCALEAWPFLEKTASPTMTPGNATLSTGWPTDFNKVIYLVDTVQGIGLVPEEQETINKKYAYNLTLSGNPIYYYFVGSSPRLFPIPSNANTCVMAYTSVPAALALTTDVPVLPLQHHRVLLLGSLFKLYAMEDEPDTAAEFKALYEDKVEKIRADIWNRQFDRPRRIYDVFEYDY